MREKANSFLSQISKVQKVKLLAALEFKIENYLSPF